MREVLDETEALESTTVGVFRTAATVKGGRRFSFAALVVVGNRGGQVGIGYGKANQVPPAIEKAQKEARRKMRSYPLQGRTIPHAVTGCFGACRVRLVPASPGTGVIAGAAVRAPLEMLGIQDCLTKAYGSRNSKNLVKAVMNGLEQLGSKQTVASLRNTELETTTVEEAITRAQAFVGDAPDRPITPIPAPKSETTGRRGGGRGRSGPGGRGGGGRGRPRRPAGGEAQSERKPETKAEQKPETKPETKPKTKPETKPEPKAETKPEPKAETKPEPKTEDAS
jgi:small subunit ribosomal protein S5